MGGQERRRRPHSNRPRDEADRGGRAASPSGQEMKFSCFRVFVAYAVLVSGAPIAGAQMTGAPTAGYKREAGMTSSTVPAPLREIGFDQHIGAFVPLDTTFRD